MWSNKTQKLGLEVAAKRGETETTTSMLIPKELSSREDAAEPERVKVCGTCRATLPRYKGYIWIQDFCRAVDCLCGFRRGAYEIVLTRRAIEALCVIAKLANSKVYCYKEKSWVRLLEPACVFYTDKVG